jgi:hypothetical protein
MSIIESPRHLKQKTGRSRGRPVGSSNPGVVDRHKRWQLQEKYAALVDKYGPTLCERVMCTPAEDGKGPDGHGFAYTFDQQVEILKLMEERAYGRPAQAVQIDQSSVTDTEITYNIRWLPPDPNDHSKVIQPEPDDPKLVAAAAAKREL